MRGSLQKQQRQRKKTISGIVTNCLNLDICEMPDSHAKVLAVVPVLSEMVVDIDASVDNYYKVCSTAGIEGFCQKKYIALRH